MDPMTTSPLTPGLAAALRRLAADRDEAAWGIVLSAAGPALEGLARRLTGDSELAHDAVQETLLRVRDLAGGFSAPSVDPDAAALRWIMRITANTCLHLLRRERRLRQRARRAVEATPAAAPAAPEAALLRDEALGHLRSELAELPVAVREAIVLRHVAGLAFAEVAAALGTSEDAAKKRVGRGLDTLRQRLGRLGVACSVAVLVGSLEAMPAAEGGGALVAAVGPDLLRSAATAQGAAAVGGLSTLAITTGLTVAAMGLAAAVIASVCQVGPPRPPAAVVATEQSPPVTTVDPRDAALLAELDRERIWQGRKWPGLRAVGEEKEWPPIGGAIPLTVQDEFRNLDLYHRDPPSITGFIPCRLEEALVPLRHEALIADEDEGGLCRPRDRFDRLAAYLGAVWKVQAGEVVFSASAQGHLPCVDLGRQVALAGSTDHPRRLADCIAGLAKDTGIAIHLLPEAAIRGERPVDVRIEGLHVEQTLDWLAYMGGLSWWTERGSVVFGGDSSVHPKSSTSADLIVKVYDVQDLQFRWPDGRGTLADDLLRARFSSRGLSSGWMVVETGDGSWEGRVPAETVDTDIRTRLRAMFADRMAIAGLGICDCITGLDDQDHAAIDSRLRSLRKAARSASTLVSWLDTDLRERAQILSHLDQPARNPAVRSTLRSALFHIATQAGVSMVLDPAVSVLEVRPVLPELGTWRQMLDRLPGIRWRVHGGAVHVIAAPPAAAAPSSGF